MSTPTDDWRKRTVTTLARHVEREGWPRLTVTLLLLVTGLLGFLVSAVMLGLGLDAMWLRYPLAASVAYVAFLFLLRIWAGKELARVLQSENLRALEEAGVASGPAPRRQRRSRSRLSDLLNIPDIGLGDLGDGCLPVVAVAVLIGAAAALVAIVVAAPALVAEVFLDAVLVAGLYHRLRGIERRHWFVTAVRRTWLPALCTTGGLALAGWAMQEAVPEASSIGPVFERLVDGWRQR